MHKKLGNKEYDQSVTCLADDLKTLETHSNKPRTPKTLSQQTIEYISTQA